MKRDQSIFPAGRQHDRREAKSIGVIPLFIGKWAKHTVITIDPISLNALSSKQEEITFARLPHYSRRILGLRKDGLGTNYYWKFILVKNASYDGDKVKQIRFLHKRRIFPCVLLG